MAGIFKNLDASDIRLTPFRAYKSYGAADTYTTYSAIINVTAEDGKEDIGNDAVTGSEGVVFTTYSASANSVWHSINSQFYKYYYSNPKAAFAQLNHTRQPRNLHDKALVISMPQRYFGEGIEPSSFSMTVGGTVYEGDLYGNVVRASGRWNAAGEISASNIVYTLNPSVFADQLTKTITIEQPPGGTIYPATVQLNNIYISASQYETVFRVSASSGTTSSVVITPDGPEANQLFNFQNKDYTIILSARNITGDGVLLEKKQSFEITKIDENGNVGTQNCYRYPYSLHKSGNNIVFSKSDGSTTLTQTSAWSLNISFPIILRRSGSQFALANGTNSTTFTDTLYSNERYCINNAPIHIGADENGENGPDIVRIGNVTFLNYGPSNMNVFEPVRVNSFNNAYATVGNIFRQQGFVVITDKTLVSAIESSGISSLSYKGTTTIYENEISCTVNAGEFGVTYNPTAHTYDPTIDQYKMADFATGSDFRPYVTRIGLYSDRSELVAIGTLSQPIQMPKDVDTTFIVRYDC
jgi:hypothetical protein